MSQITRDGTFIITTAQRKKLPSWQYGGIEAGGGFVVRKIRGFKSRDTPSLMAEFGAAFQFFDGFGENWHALEEMLRYLDEWLPAAGYRIVFTAPEQLLCDEPEAFEWLIKVLAGAARSWATPIQSGDHFDRPARTFEVFFEASPATAELLEQHVRICGEAVRVER